MFKLMRRNKKGFTLIELIVVIAILAILAAIAIPTFSGITQSANDKVKLANAKSIATAINAFNNLNPSNTSLQSKPADYTGAKSVVGAALWPSGLSATDAGAAWPLITITNGVAVAAEAAVAPSPT